MSTSQSPAAAHGRRGGRFDGYPVASLVAGASCVLSSAHALWDDAAAEYSSRLYDHMLKRGARVGEAVVAVRTEMAESWYGNPLTWAATVVWGNP